MKIKFIKTSIATVAFILTVSTVSNFSLLAQFGDGNGTVSNPYQIKTKQHLELLTDSVNNGYNWSKGKYFKVMNDITNPLTKTIGLSVPEKSFQGNFDGQNNTIILDINETAPNYSVGLFSCFYTGSIKNVIVTGSINVINPSAPIGGIVGSIITGFITDYSGKANIIRISNCVNNADLTATVNDATTNGITGGIVGSAVLSQYQLVNDEMIIENCTNIGSIKGQMVGGILGNFSINIAGVCIVNNCENFGLIDGDNIAGGVVGLIDNRATVSNCFNGGVVSGKIKNSIGCIVGIKNDGTVINCHYDMQMCGEE